MLMKNTQHRTSNIQLPTSKARAKPPQATSEPPQGHLQAIYCGVQSHLKATPRPPQGHPKATPRLHQGYTKATSEPAEATPVIRVRRLMPFLPSAFGIRPFSSRTHSILALVHCSGANPYGMFEFMLLVRNRIVKALVLVVVLVAIHST